MISGIPGSKLVSSQTRYNITGPGPDFQVLGSDSKRVGLIISSPSLSTISISFGDPSADAADMQLTTGSVPWQVTIDDIGTLITQPVHIFAHGATAKGGIIATRTL